MGRFTGVLGMAVILGAAWLFSTNRRAIKLKTIAWGLGLQLTLGWFVLRSDAGSSVFGFLGAGANRLLSYSYAGSAFVFGDIGLPKELSRLGFSFAFQVLPTIIFIAAFFAVLYHIGVMQLIIRAAAWLMTRIMGASGAESLNVAASIFMGQTEAPLTIRPFLPKLTKSELMVVMTSGMAHISGGMMAGYINVGGADPKNLLTAVIMTAPGTLLMAKMLVPETEQPLTAGRVEMPPMEKESNVLGAIARGTVDGLHLALNVGAMLITFIALLALLNAMMGGIHNWPHMARSSHLCHRHLRSLRLRQLQLDWHSDRWYRRAGARTAHPTRKIWHSRHARRHYGKLNVGIHRRNSLAKSLTASISGILS